jgi:galactose mutarotase-like enzyme
MTFQVENADAREMPYAVGFHPAFPWPLHGKSRAGHSLEFEAEEHPEVPDLTPDGLLRRSTRPLPFAGRRLLLGPELFPSGALVLRNVRSRSVRFASPGGAALEYAVANFPHLALWTKPSAPFLSIEAWTGEPDPVGFEGQLFERPSIRRLAPNATATHTVRMTWHGGDGR